VSSLVEGQHRTLDYGIAKGVKLMELHSQSEFMNYSIFRYYLTLEMMGYLMKEEFSSFSLCIF